MSETVHFHISPKDPDNQRRYNALQLMEIVGSREAVVKLVEMVRKSQDSADSRARELGTPQSQANTEALNGLYKEIEGLFPGIEEADTRYLATIANTLSHQGAITAGQLEEFTKNS